MKIRHCLPLLGFGLVTVIIGYGFVIPRSSIAAINELSAGVGSSIVGTCLTYWAGVRTVYRDFVQPS